MEQNAKYYDQIYELGYDTSRYKDLYITITDMVNETSKILDVGCGTGDLGSILSQKVLSYKGLDFSQEAVKQSQSKNLDTIHHNIYDFDYMSESYDTILFIEVLEHIRDIEVLRKIPNGKKIIFSVPDFPDPAHLRTYNKDKILDRYNNLISDMSIQEFSINSGKIYLVEGIINHKRNTISVSMIVKNETEVLSRCLESISGQFDEIVIVDTGSTDDSMDIAKSYGAKVYEEPWEDDFSKARNASIEKCTSEWILIMDADDILNTGQTEDIKQYVQRADKDKVAYFKIRYGNLLFNQVRLFPNDPTKFFYQGACHNYLSVSYGDYTDFQITHIRSPRKDPDRNLRILLKEYEKNRQAPRTLFYLAREYKDKLKIGASLYWFRKYLDVVDNYKTKEPWRVSEVADAYYSMADCYAIMGDIEEAVEHCLLSIGILPTAKAPYLLLQKLDRQHAGLWKKFCNLVNNEGALFPRIE